ncbi:MAG: hypothetical protein AB8H86_07120 [Polyangiales bacterium]
MVRIFTVLFALLALSACGGPSEYVVVGTARAAGADGLITVEKTESNNLLSIEVENLAPPGRISEGTTVYVVWFKPPTGPLTAQGTLEYDPDDRVGRFSATSIHAELQVIVSAEIDATANSPSEVVILRQDVVAPN